MPEQGRLGDCPGDVGFNERLRGDLGPTVDGQPPRYFLDATIARDGFVRLSYEVVLRNIEVPFNEEISVIRSAGSCRAVLSGRTDVSDVETRGTLQINPPLPVGILRITSFEENFGEYTAAATACTKGDAARDPDSPPTPLTQGCSTRNLRALSSFTREQPAPFCVLGAVGDNLTGDVSYSLQVRNNDLSPLEAKFNAPALALAPNVKVVGDARQLARRMEFQGERRLEDGTRLHRWRWRTPLQDGLWEENFSPNLRIARIWTDRLAWEYTVAVAPGGRLPFDAGSEPIYIDFELAADRFGTSGSSLRAEPAGRVLGGVAVGQPTAFPGAFRLLNDGPASIQVTRIAMEGAQSADFRARADGGDVPFWVAGGTSAGVTVEIVPQTLGQRRATLVLEGVTPGGAVQSLRLGVEATGQSAALHVLPTKLKFRRDDALPDTAPGELGAVRIALAESAGAATDPRVSSTLAQLTPSAAIALLNLGRADAAAGAPAERARARQTLASHLLAPEFEQRLAAEGLVRREQHPDTGAVAFRLTDQGVLVYRALAGSPALVTYPSNLPR